MTRNVCAEFRGSLYLGLSLLLLISLASCLPEFKHPIPPPPELKADQQILGTWVRTTKKGSKEQLSIFPRSSGWTDVVYISGIDSKESQDGINVAVFEGYSASVNKQRFLCFRLREKDVHEAEKEIGGFGYRIANYETPGNGTLIVKLFSMEKAKELVKEGKLKGEIVKQGQYFDKVTITSSSEELVEAVSREGLGAFVEPGEDDVLVFSRGVAR